MSADRRVPPSPGEPGEPEHGRPLARHGPAGAEWPPAAVRALRGHLGLSQGALADRLGTKQQTISEWETGARRPRRMSRRLLHLVAEQSGFYRVAPAGGADETAEAGETEGTS